MEIVLLDVGDACKRSLVFQFVKKCWRQIRAGFLGLSRFKSNFFRTQLTSFFDQGCVILINRWLIVYAFQLLITFIFIFIGCIYITSFYWFLFSCELIFVVDHCWFSEVLGSNILHSSLLSTIQLLRYF